MAISYDLRLQNRQKWSFQLDSIMFGIASAVGMSTIWRFPYMMYRNGGVVFLIPYIFFTIIFGLPMLYLELLIGQCGSLAPHLTFYRMAPVTAGIGIALTVISFIVGLYYSLITAWSIRYFVASFTVPWMSCTNWWNTERCLESSGYQNSTYYDGDYSGPPPSLPAAEFWKAVHYNVLMFQSWDEMPMAIALALSWLFVFLCFIGGVKTAGKFVYPMVILPVLFMVLLFIRGVTLPGSAHGIKYYLVPNFTKLVDLQTWSDAAYQVFYSLGLSMGVFITIGSYNKFRTFVFRDALIIVLLQAVLSFFFGFVVFMFTGFLAMQSGLPINQVLESGLGLAFFTMAASLGSLPTPTFWCIVWFLTTFFLSLGSQLGLVNVVLTAILDQFPRLHKFGLRLVITFVYCLFSLVVGGLIYLGSFGHLRFLFVDYYITLPWFPIAFLQVVAICYIHGFWRLAKDICLMMGIRYRSPFQCSCSTNPVWMALFAIVLPILLAILTLKSFITYHPVHAEDYHFADWVHIVFGWFLILFCTLLWVFIGALFAIIYHVIKRKSLASIIKPTEDWPQELLSQQNTIPLRGGVIISGPPEKVIVTTHEQQPFIHKFS